jgi:hypothetical protein
MKNPTIQDQIIQDLNAHIASECRPVDVERRYADMLDEIYSFDKVGGPFAGMLPSCVLREVDPTAYRCGKNDWLDSEDITEVDGEYYDNDDLDRAKAEFIEGKESELSDLENELDEMENGEDAPGEQVTQSALDSLAERIRRAKAEIAELESHSF